MLASDFLRLIQGPAEAAFAGVIPTPASLEATVMMAAIAGQETSWSARIQVPNGQARGFWQCEQRGAVFNVITNGWAAPRLKSWCLQRAIAPGLDTLFEAIAWNDNLAYAVARLNLALDPSELPDVGDIDGAWSCYVRVWRPGKPSRDRWSLVYPAVVAAAHTDAVAVA